MLPCYEYMIEIVIRCTHYCCEKSGVITRSLTYSLTHIRNCNTHNHAQRRQVSNSDSRTGSSTTMFWRTALISELLEQVTNVQTVHVCCLPTSPTRLLALPDYELLVCASWRANGLPAPPELASMTFSPAGVLSMMLCKSTGLLVPQPPYSCTRLYESALFPHAIPSLLR